MPRLSQLLAFTGASLVTFVSAQCALQPTANIATAEGVEFKLLRTGLQRPRHLVVDTEGNLLIAESGLRGVRRVVLDDGEGLDVCVGSANALISNSNVCHLLWTPMNQGLPC